MDNLNQNQEELVQNSSLSEIKEPEDNKVGLVFWAYILFLIPLLSKSRFETFVWYHTKQAIGFFLLETIAIFLIIYLNSFAWTVTLIIFLFLVWCYCIYNVVMGRQKPIPGLGHIIQAIKI